MLLSAGHTFADRTSPLHVHGDGRTVRLTHDIVGVDESEDVGVELDVVHMRLNRGEVDLLRIPRALDLTKVPMTLAIPKAPEFVVIGYPLSRSSTDAPRRRLMTEQIMLAADEANAATYNSLGTNPELHLVLRYDIHRVRGRARTGASRGPKPKGMSGGGMFLVRPTEELELAVI